MTTREFDPLFGEPPDEIPLDNAPLTRVLAQVHFTPILRLMSEDYVALFQERIRNTYPIVHRDTHKLVTVFRDGPDVESNRTEVIWRFVNATMPARVSVTSNFLSLETMCYTSRKDFMERFREVVASLKAVVGSAHVTRIGVRYVNHVKLPEFSDMEQMLRPAMLGVLNTDLRSRMQHTLSETIFDVAEGHLLARWGLLPPNGTHDPDVLLPVPKNSWFLDIDVFKQYSEPYEDMDADAVHAAVFSLTKRSYAFFHWATTDRLLEVYGGRV